MVDVQILHLGISNKGSFDERTIAESELKKLGVGRILDQLASLKERNLIEMNYDGSFSVTNIARHILWDNKIPLWIKILRVLEIKSQNLENLSSFLLTPPEKIQEELEDLRKKQLVLMSPLRNETGLVKMYEILPEGLEEIERVQSVGFGDKPPIKNSQDEIFSIIDVTIKEINGIQEIPNIKKEKIISNLIKIKKKLEI